MKQNKNKLILFLLLLLVFLFTSCDEVLTVVTENENGEKIVTKYISFIGEKVYDNSASFKNWEENDQVDYFLEEIEDECTFTIKNSKDQIVVLGNEESALELKFFEGGYSYMLYMNATTIEQTNKALESAFDY